MDMGRLALYWCYPFDPPSRNRVVDDVDPVRKGTGRMCSQVPERIALSCQPWLGIYATYNDSSQ
jgi:hypothetical protein